MKTLIKDIAKALTLAIVVLKCTIYVSMPIWCIFVPVVLYSMYNEFFTRK